MIPSLQGQLSTEQSFRLKKLHQEVATAELLKIAEDERELPAVRCEAARLAGCTLVENWKTNGAQLIEAILWHSATNALIVIKDDS